MSKRLKSYITALLCCAMLLFGMAPGALAATSEAADNSGSEPCEAASVMASDAAVDSAEGELVEVSVDTLDDVVGRAKDRSTITRYAASPSEPDIVDSDSSRVIDHFNLPEWALELYAALVEGADNDGISDFLIDPIELTDYQSTYVQGEIAELYGATYQVLAIDTSADAKSNGYEVSSYEINCLETAIYSFDHDHSETFWMWPRYAYLYVGTMLYYVVALPDETLEYTWIDDYTTESIRADIERCETCIAEIVSGLESGYGQDYSDAEAARYFNDWLTMHNEYNTALSSGEITWETAPSLLPWRCLCALEGRIGADGPTCDAYARAFKVLCDAVGIDCVLIVGDAANRAQDADTGLLEDGESHIWDQVRLEDGNWYIVDVTWDDPLGGTSGAVSGYESEHYLLLGAGTIAEGTPFWGTHAAYGVGDTILDSDTFRPSGIAYESDCALSDLSVSSGELVPGFSSSEAFYQLSVSVAASPLSFATTVPDSSSVVELYTSTTNAQDIDMPLDLAEGEMSTWIQITPPDSETTGGETYRITIDVAAEPTDPQDGGDGGGSDGGDGGNGTGGGGADPKTNGNLGDGDGSRLITQIIAVNAKTKVKKGKKAEVRVTGVKTRLAFKANKKAKKALKIKVKGKKKLVIKAKKAAKCGKTYQVKVYATASAKYAKSPTKTIKVRVV